MFRRDGPGVFASRTRYGIGLIVLFLAYFYTAKLGLAMDAVGGFATLVWPPTGIALSALALFGYRFWPGVALAAFSVNYLQGAPFWVAFGIATGNTLEAVAGVYLLRRYVGFRESLDRLRDVLGLILLAAVGSTLISSGLGVASLILGGVIQPSAFEVTWRAWWLGDMLGDLVVAPVLLTSFQWRALRLDSRRIGEGCLLMLAALGVSCFVFTDFLTVRTKGYELVFLVFPVIIWSAIRFGAAPTALVTFLISLLSIWGESRGIGPFRRGTLAESLALLQTFMATVAVTSLVLAAVMAELVRSEQRSREAAGDLTAANRDLEMMLYVIGHDLKEPIRSIENFSNILKERQSSRLDEKGRDYLDRVLAASIRMRRLLDDILRISRVKTGEIKKDRASGEGLVKEAVDRLDAVIRETGARIEVQSGLPVLHVDRTMAVEAIYNLISNALKFSRNGHAPEIEIGPYAGSEGEGISVRDRGCGVPAHLSERIFNLFERGVGRDVEGTGAGLAIVQRVAERHGGRAWVRPRPGISGSEFIITFQLRRSRDT